MKGLNGAKLNSLTKLYSEYISGRLTREEYWINVDQIVSDLNKLSLDLPSRVSSITILPNFSYLNFKFSENINLNLKLSASNYRSAANLILAHNGYEDFETSVFVNMLEICSKFVDIGANIGYYTIISKVAKPEIEVISIEPNCDAVRDLLINLELNLINQVKIVETALANKDSEAQDLFVPKFTGTPGGGLKNLHPEEGYEKQKVALKRFDDLFGEMHARTDLIKIDAEGAEFEILMGAIQSIERDSPIIFVELVRKWMIKFNSTPQDFLAVLRKIGYRCFSIGEHSLRDCILIDDLTQESNFIFIHENNTRALEIAMLFSVGLNSKLIT